MLFSYGLCTLFFVLFNSDIKSKSKRYISCSLLLRNPFLWAVVLLLPPSSDGGGGEQRKRCRCFTQWVRCSSGQLGADRHWIWYFSTVLLFRGSVISLSLCSRVEAKAHPSEWNICLQKKTHLREQSSEQSAFTRRDYSYISIRRSLIHRIHWWSVR